MWSVRQLQLEYLSLYSLLRTWIHARLNLISSWSSRKVGTSSLICNYISTRRGCGRSSSMSGSTKKNMCHVSMSTTIRPIDTMQTFSSLSLIWTPSPRKTIKRYIQVFLCLGSYEINCRAQNNTSCSNRLSKTFRQWSWQIKSFQMKWCSVKKMKRLSFRYRIAKDKKLRRVMKIIETINKIWSTCSRRVHQSKMWLIHKHSTIICLSTWRKLLVSRVIRPNLLSSLGTHNKYSISYTTKLFCSMKALKVSWKRWNPSKKQLLIK